MAGVGKLPSRSSFFRAFKSRRPSADMPLIWICGDPVRSGVLVPLAFAVAALRKSKRGDDLGPSAAAFTMAGMRGEPVRSGVPTGPAALAGRGDAVRGSASPRPFRASKGDADAMRLCRLCAAVASDSQYVCFLLFFAGLTLCPL